MLIRTEKQLELLGERIGRHISKSADRQIGKTKKRSLYSLRVNKSANSPRVFALVGELGSGKTTFVRGFARGLGVRSRITSPTFILARRHRIPRGGNSKHEARNTKQYQSSKPKNSKHVSDFDIRISNLKYLWHFDLYRLRGVRDFSGLHFREIIEDPKNIVVIEWAERARAAIPKNAMWIQFRHHVIGRTVHLSRQLV